MKRKLSLIVALAALAALTVVSVSSAVVNYDPATGGFVGKGDVQTALGLNNAQIQAAAASLEFAYSDSIVVEGGACIRPNGTEHPNDVWRRTTGLDAEVVYEARQKNKQPQVTGFILEPVSGGGNTTYTDQCNNNFTEAPGEILDVQEGDGLTVNGVPLPNTP